MKNYTFSWQCDEAWGEVELELTDKEVDIIKSAYRDAFLYLEEVSDLLHDFLVHAFGHP